MLFSRGCQYAIQAMLRLNSGSPDEYLSIRRIAADCDLSPSFLSKVLSGVVSYGLLESLKGPGGGVRLARPARDITLMDVVDATDGCEFMGACVLGFRECSDRVPCPVHKRWSGLRENISVMLSSKSLEDVSRKLGPVGHSAKKPQKRKRTKRRRT
jgi:Rrf2 family protein